MAEFNTKCPHCGTELAADDQWVGMEVECFSCKQKFVIPPKPAAAALPKLTIAPPRAGQSTAPEADIPLKPRPADGGSFIFICPSCGEQAELPATMKGQRYTCAACAEESIAEAVTEKKCPFCGETIKIGAQICKFCKRDLSGAPHGFAAAAPAEETFPFICPDCDSFVELPISMKGQLYECKVCAETHEAKPAIGRKCPYCGEVIKIQAKICKRCHKPVPPLAAPRGNARPVGGAGQLRPIGVAPAGWGITEDEAENIKKLFMWWWICLAAGLPTLFLGFIAAAVIQFILLYKYWKLVPADEAETTPGKAVGFCFIPFFNFYWLFVAMWKLAKHYDEFDEPGHSVSTFALIYVITSLAGGIPYIGLLATIASLVFQILWMVRMKNCAVNLPRIG